MRRSRLKGRPRPTDLDVLGDLTYNLDTSPATPPETIPVLVTEHTENARNGRATNPRARPFHSTRFSRGM